MATIQGETMLDSDHNGPFFKETLASQIEQLGYFRIEEPPFDIYLLEYHLQTIFNTLFYAMDKYPSLGPHLDPVDQSKLAQICIQLIDSEEFVNYCSKWHHVDHMWLNEVWALKILVLITKQPFVETHSREILNLIHKSLANKLNRPCAPIDKGQFGEIMGLIANCLAQDNFKHIISSIEAQNMIKDLVLPLAVCCLGEETQHDKRAFKVFQRDFHGKYSRDTRALVDGGQFKFAYPLVVRLLLALAKQSESSSSSSGYIRVFESMLGTAMETGSITDEHIVALSVIRTSGFSPLIASLIDLLTKSEGLQRAHIAYMIWWELMFTNDNESMTETDRVTFTMIMIDDLIAKNDELLDQIAISSFSLIKDDDKFDWRRRVSGKEMRIIKKLVGTGCKPNQLNKFLKHLDHIKGSETLEFYTLTRLPISQAIYKLYHLVKLTSKRSPDVMEQFVDYFECLENLLRLHRHRLEQDAEMKLMEVFDLLSDDQFIKDRKRDHGFILVFANAYLVYPYAWNSIIKMIRLVQQTEPISPNRKLAQDTLNKTFSHLLMIDADYFYGKFATPEVLKLLFEYCERIADSSSVKCLLKEILLTWPKEFQKTRLDSVAHRLMLKKFIELLIDALDSARDRVRASRRADEINGFLDRLSGLVIAFSRHRDQLNEVLDELGEEQENRDSWLKSNMSNWTRLVIDSANRIGCSVRMDSYLFKNDLKGCFMLTEFADIVVAHEGLLMIRDGSIECHKLAKSFGALLETVQLALDTNLERTPVNSREYKRYQVIKASLQDERMVDWLFPMVRQVRTQWFNNAAIGRRLCNRVRDIRDSLQATTSRPSS